MRDLLGYINSNFDICKWIDTNAGITATGREDLYVEVATKYFETLEDHCRKIEDAYKAKNYRDYTIYVHSLKSSSRLIGATDISERSKELEDAGNAMDTEKIDQKTAGLLADCRNLNSLMQGFFAPDSNLPEIETEMLEDAFVSLREVVDAFDFDSADVIMNMLAKYSMPEKYKETYAKIKTLITNVDREEVMAVLDDVIFDFD